MYKKLFHIKSLRRKMFLSFTGLFVTALFVLQSVNSYQSYILLEENLTDSVHQSMKLALANIDYYFEDAGNLASGMIIEPDVQASLASVFDYDSLDTKLMLRTLERTIRKYASSRPYIHKIYLVNKTGDILDNFLHDMELPVFYTGNKSALSNLHHASYISSPTPVISLQKPIFSADSSNRRIGTLIVDVDYRKIDQIIRSFSLPMEGNVLLFNQEKEYLSQAGSHTPAFLPEELPGIIPGELRSDSNGFLKISGQKYMCMSEVSALTGFTMVTLIPASLFNRSIATSMLLTLLLFILCIIASVLISRKIINLLYQPVSLLTASMHAAENGDLKGFVTYRRQDELLPLVNGYNSMLTKINGLLKEITQKEQNRQKAELYALQAQINPHFLYNTLNSIRYLAKLHKAQDIRDLTAALIRLSRASLDSDKFISIGTELQLVQDYLLIQSARYGPVFKYSCEMESPSLADCLLPRFSIQPLVENALFHGILPNGSGKIHLQIQQKQSIIIITVCDNGIGIPETKRDEINSRLSGCTNISEDELSTQYLRKLKNIGIENINLRIKLNYSQEYGLSLAPASDSGGICATMTIPLRKEHDNAQCNDC